MQVRFRRFAVEVAAISSPLYARLAHVVADDAGAGLGDGTAADRH